MKKLTFIAAALLVVACGKDKKPVDAPAAKPARMDIQIDGLTVQNCKNHAVAFRIPKTPIQIASQGETVLVERKEVDPNSQVAIILLRSLSLGTLGPKDVDQVNTTKKSYYFTAKNCTGTAILMDTDKKSKLERKGQPSPSEKITVAPRVQQAPTIPPAKK